MLANHRNSKKQGDVGVGAAIGYFSSKGYTVCIPLTDSQDYDLVIDIENILYRVQVKTTRHKPGKYYITNLKVCGGNRSGNSSKLFNPDLIELVFILTNDGIQYLIPSKKIEATSAISLGEKYKQYIVFSP